MSATLSAAEALELVAARERFGVRLGLDRMRKLVAALDHPERRYGAIHIVGTNGKSTAARTIESLLQAGGLNTGTYLSPHVVSLAERFRIGGAELDVGSVIAPVLGAVRRVDAEADEPVTQFELLTIAALNAFAEASVDVAVVEAGLGGRYDATNVLSAGIVVLTNVALDHEEQLGTTRSEIASEKLAVIKPGATVVLGESEWEAAAAARGATTVMCADSSAGVARITAEAHLGGPLGAVNVPVPSLPGRCERVGVDPEEIWDGAHNPHAVAWLEQQRAAIDHVLVLSILADKNVDEMLASFAKLGSVLVATASTNPRALPARELMERAESAGGFSRIEAVDDPVSGRLRGRELASAAGTAMLISGSLYLLHDLAAVRPRRVP